MVLDMKSTFVDINLHTCQSIDQGEHIRAACLGSLCHLGECCVGMPAGHRMGVDIKCYWFHRGSLISSHKIFTV